MWQSHVQQRPFQSERTNPTDQSLNARECLVKKQKELTQSSGTLPGWPRARPRKSGDLSLGPSFGRVPERTHYLPGGRVLDPPLREAWSINTHALIEFPPAIADGVAYVVNKYGNAQGGAAAATARCSGNGTPTRATRASRPTSPRPVYHEGRVFFAYLDGDLVAVDAETGKQSLDAQPRTPTSNPRRWRSAARSTSAPTRPTWSRCAPPTARSLWQFNSPGAIKASPSFHDGRLYVADYESAMFCLDADDRQADLAHQHDQGAALRRGRLLLLARRSPSAASTPPATTAPSSPSTNRPARSTGPSRPTTTSTARRPSPRSPAPRRASTSAPTTSTSTRSTRAPASSAGATTSAARCPGTATVIGHTVYTSSFKTRETIGIDVRTHKQDLRDAPGRLHAGGLRRPPPLPGRLLRADRAASRRGADQGPSMAVLTLPARARLAPGTTVHFRVRGAGEPQLRAGAPDQRAPASACAAPLEPSPAMALFPLRLFLGGHIRLRGGIQKLSDPVFSARPWSAPDPGNQLHGFAVGDAGRSLPSALFCPAAPGAGRDRRGDHRDHDRPACHRGAVSHA